MKDDKFPKDWDENRVRKVLNHYEGQSEAKAVAEDENIIKLSGPTVMEIPIDLVPEVRGLIARHKAA